MRYRSRDRGAASGSIVAFPSRSIHDGEELLCRQPNPLRRILPQSRARVARVEDKTLRVCRPWYVERDRLADPPRRSPRRENRSLAERFQPRLRPRLLYQHLAHETVAIIVLRGCKKGRSGHKSRRIAVHKHELASSPSSFPVPQGRECDRGRCRGSTRDWVP
jgi:hypothetical protein